MHTLLLSIFFSVAVSVFLKIARRHALRVDQAIAVNYLVAIAACLWLLQPPVDTLFQQPPGGWGILILLGLLLPSIFLVMAAAVHHAGIVLSDTAQRLSLLVPILAAFLLFGEHLSGQKALGILTAFAALACLVARHPGRRTRPSQAAASDTSEGPWRRNGWILLAVWAGYGIIDVLFKLMAKLGNQFSSTLLLSFILAAVLMVAWLILRRTTWHIHSLLSGLLLGALNFSNIYFYIRAHQHYPDNPTLVFAAMNIGVISVGVLVGAGLFAERPSRLNFVGVGLALGAVALLLPR